jgi:hypothetical protein
MPPAQQAAKSCSSSADGEGWCVRILFDCLKQGLAW